jgi:hypothetical protein
MARFDRERIVQIQALLERIDAALIVRDPGTARSADAFDGLRKQINYAAKTRRTHVSHLLALDESIRTGGNLDLVAARLTEYLRELGVERLFDVSRVEAFDIVGDPTGDVEVLEPAIVEKEDGDRITVLRIGKARRISKPVVPANPGSEEIAHDLPEVKDEALPSGNEDSSIAAQVDAGAPTADGAQPTEPVQHNGPAVEDVEATVVADNGEQRPKESLGSWSSLLFVSLVAIISLVLGLGMCSRSSDEPKSPSTTVMLETATTVQE